MTVAADLIVIVAHIDPQAPTELEIIYKAIRSVHSTIPIAMLTGHRHRKIFREFDPNAFAIESGRYFENLGIVKFQLKNGNFS